MAKNPQKSAFQITSPCYCWLWDCDKNKTKTCTFLTLQWVCIHKIVWNRLTLMNMCCDGKVPAFRENEAIKSKWTTNHKMFKDRTKIETPIIFLFVLLNFFSPRNFDTFHLNKNRNHSRTSYKTTGQWNKKKKALCAVLKISGVCVPKKYWVNDNNCGVHLQGCCGEFLCLTPPPGLWAFAFGSPREVHTVTADCSWAVFLWLRSKKVWFTPGKCRSHSAKVNYMKWQLCSLTVQKKGKEIKVDESDPKYLN